MKTYIKENGVPEQYPIMMLTGFKFFSFSWPVSMAKGFLAAWFWHKWEYWDVFQYHNLQVHYKCRRILGITIKEITEIQPTNDFATPTKHFFFTNSGLVNYMDGEFVYALSHATGDHYPQKVGYGGPKFGGKTFTHLSARWNVLNERYGMSKSLNFLKKKFFS